MPRQLGRTSELDKAATDGTSFVAVPDKARGHVGSALNVLLRCPLALLGTATKPVPSVADSPCSDMPRGQRGMQRHVGWQAAELVWWQGLHEYLHATTQVLD